MLDFLDFSLQSIIENPLILSGVVIILTWLIRKAKWDIDGPAAMWLSMGVAALIAVVDQFLFRGGFPPILTCRLVLTDPFALISCLWETAANIAAIAAPLWIATQGIYHLLRRKIGEKSIMERVTARVTGTSRNL